MSEGTPDLRNTVSSEVLGFLLLVSLLLSEEGMSFYGGNENFGLLISSMIEG